MSKTFKSAHTKRNIEIARSPLGDVAIAMSDIMSRDIVLNKTCAPAIALAILEAAGIEAIPFDEGPETIPGHAVWALRHHVQELEAKAKEAADQKVLKAEAFTLYSAAPFRSGVHSFELLSDGAKVQWLSIARASRDLHGGTK